MKTGSVRVGIAILVSGVVASPALSHFYMLLPAEHSVKRGRQVTISLVMGHPYERDMSDAPVPVAAKVRFPDGKQQSFAGRLQEAQEVCPVTRKAVTVFRGKFSPEKRGDYVFSADSSGRLEDERIWVDHTKVVLHVQGQKGWDGQSRQMMEWVPLTRPYGLEAGFVFRAQLIRRDGGSVDGVMVEIEQVQPKAPHEDDLPASELMTRAAKTDPNGVVTVTLDEPGWWLICGTSKSPKKLELGGRERETVRRAILMVYVGPHFTQRFR